jgi:hypothetical protein
MIIREMHEARKKSVENRLANAVRFNASGDPVFSATSIHYEMSEKTRAINVGGIGLIHKLALESGLVDAINSKLHLLKMNFPYVESDHVLNIAYNAICGGVYLEDIELLRNDETYLDALGAESIPDPTTAGDFCRRFDSPFKIGRLQDAIDEARLNVWKRQPDSFFDEAIIDMDGHVLETTGSCKKGMDVAYNGKWGYHPLIVSLANTQEVLGLLNRPGNWNSQQRSVWLIERGIGLCRRAGFRRILLRGDSKFSQTEHFDRWDSDGVVFHFGYDAKKNLKGIADNLPKSRWKKLKRPPKYQVKTKRRKRPDRVKEEVVRRREYENQILQYEEVAEFKYRPTACKKTYRMIAIRKHIRVEKGQQWLFDKSPYLFYITNDWDSSAAEVVFSCNDRCNQENLIEQLKNGVRALRAPVDNLLSNWAYMVMTALAWNLKAWSALWLPENGRWAQKYRQEKQNVLRMDFRTFVNYFIAIPCQIIRSGRKLIYRLLNWNPYMSVFRRLAIQLKC